MKKYTEPVYKHLFPQVVSNAKKLVPLLESSFKDELARFGEREDIRQERIKFATEQMANRLRIDCNTNQLNPLNEDRKIFGGFSQDLAPLFESVTFPGNITSSGDIVMPPATGTLPGGQWNAKAGNGSGDAMSHVFGLQGHIALNCKGFDLIPMIAVDTPTVITNFVDEIYGGGDLDSTEALPSFVNFSNTDVTTFEFTDKNDLLRGKTKVVVATDKDGSALELLFLLQNTENASWVVQVLGTGTVAAGVFTKGELEDLTVIEALDAINEATAPVMIIGGNEFPLTVGESKIGHTSATRTNIIEATSNNADGSRMHRKQHKKGPKFKLGIISLDKTLQMQGREIEADTDNLQIRDFAAFGVNVISRLYNAVHNNILQSIDEDILNHLYALGVQHAYQAYQAQGINHSIYIGKPSNAKIAMKDIKAKYENMLGIDVKDKMGDIENQILSSQYENQTTHADRLFGRILLTAEFIGFNNRIGTPDFLMTSGTLLAAMKKSSTYTIVPTKNTLSQGPELDYAGSLYDMRVYRNNKTGFNDPRILIGRRGNDSDPGAKFLAYDLAASAQAMVEQTMAPKIRVWSRYNILDVGFHPELNYYTLLAWNDSAWV